MCRDIDTGMYVYIGAMSVVPKNWNISNVYRSIHLLIKFWNIYTCNSIQQGKPMSNSYIYIDIDKSKTLMLIFKKSKAQKNTYDMIPFLSSSKTHKTNQYTVWGHKEYYF